MENIIKAAKEILKFIGVAIISEYAIPTHFNNNITDSFDCGIFTLLSLLYTYQNQPYDYYQQIVTKYRQLILQNLAIVGFQIEISQELLERIIKL
ncbi:unnamed protein product [Paramecium octaurelia]|uniref:Uncharacterized protein n=1 Tax=Paramecium octaurelia TaxID=43137 RepID=A0A8S1TV48_PAROT|nr:unnamed protein product [Paramecium octaurelia]